MSGCAGVIGAGAWGTALAQVAARAGWSVRLHAREPEVVASINAMRENALFLPGVRLEAGVRATSDLVDLAGCDLILAVPPAQHMRAALTAFAPHARPGAPLVLCAKGVEAGTLKLMTQVAQETLPQAALAVLSGPSFAGEVARGLPTAVTLACEDAEVGMRVMAALAAPGFRPYLVDDMIGAEAGGAVKNVLAIACGIVEGRGLGRSAHAALITRGFAEMTRLGVALGAKAETLAGLCGLGDLVLTCSSPQSRNMSVGLALGRGERLEAALAGKLSVAEGVASAPGVRRLGARFGIEMPISEAVAAVLAARSMWPALSRRSWPVRSGRRPSRKGSEMGEIVIVAYRPKPGCEAALDALVESHVPRLRALGFATAREPVAGRAADGTVVEVFEWETGAVEAAHKHPDVHVMWGEFGAVCDCITLRDLAESADLFPHFTPLEA